MSGPVQTGRDKNKSYRLISCSSPRKSLVKGERFIRALKRSQSCLILGLVISHYKTTVCDEFRLAMPLPRMHPEDLILV